jgi:hypothetical protein
MPTATYIALANTTLSANAGTVTFSNIPNTYRDLVAVINVVGLTGSPTARGGHMTVNGSGGSSVFMYGAGSGSGTSGTDGSDLVIPFANAHGVFIVNIMDYSATDKHKTILTRASTASASVWAIASRFASTNAVTSIAFNGPDSSADEFLLGSTFALYGIVS